MAAGRVMSSRLTLLRKSNRLLSLIVCIAFALSVLLIWTGTRAINQIEQEDIQLIEQLQKTKTPPKHVSTTRHQKTNPKILTAYLESPSTLQRDVKPLPIRNTTKESLRKIEFPHVNSCATLMQDFPIDDFPTGDPFLPWLHDFFPSRDGSSIQFIAQNRRRCDTGDDREAIMSFWEPQIALFQPIPIVQQDDNTFYLADSPETATHPETRFLCRFHTDTETFTTVSKYPFNYEYVTWRKHKQAMFEVKGKDVAQFWLSTLLFSCPVPPPLQSSIREGAGDTTQVLVYLDLIPIRTLARRRFFLTQEHVGPKYFAKTKIFNATLNFGTQHRLPDLDDSGRWQNLPICPLPPISLTTPDDSSTHSIDNHSVNTEPMKKSKPFRLVACTWASASYTRRGDVVTVSDSASRLVEWIEFNLLVGFDHVVVYDNTDIPVNETSPIYKVTAKYSPEVVSYHRWPCHICNNNRPQNPNPGERSSQYGAEASCRERYGPLTEWLSFTDADEYLVPMTPGEDHTWKPLLDEMDDKKIRILKFLSSRGKPRVNLMGVNEDQSTCKDPLPPRGPNVDRIEPCIGPLASEPLLSVYNCDFIRPPKPERFARAMKQIYRPDHVLSHFVHYSTVTTDIAQTYIDLKKTSNEEFFPFVHASSWVKKSPEIFLDELNQGCLIHARSVLPHETMRKTAECFLGSKTNCVLGYACDDSVKFSDSLHKSNSFHNPDGSFCNCWRNQIVDDFFVPKLKERLGMIS
jgi:hypothetical protein